ncbi:hypothetical protein GBAR_LOCUS9934 [Geodia barretti]|uniref:MBD domain-containing protein n=1 Tax=Geodia barretti TaxID=519541 RepID=A0AA35RR28_GEOBA|nr:hypothetical protein GBAR_LOCUS9934 [Geodia barretti]
MEGLVELVDERFAAIKRQHFPSYLVLLRNWRESLKNTEEWMVKKEQEFSQYADTVIAQYQKGPPALQDHTYYRYEDENSFVAHNCSEACWAMGMTVKSPSKFSSLSLPLLLGWQRVFMMRPPSEGNRTDTYYSAPCGRRLRSMEEVNQFLESTSVAESNILITNFTFDPLCSLVCPPYNAKSAGAKVFIPDITCDTRGHSYHRMLT